MTEKNVGIPPAKNLNGISRPGEGAVIKPQNMQGTLIRLWDLTKGHRKGLGWILLLSALSSGVSVLSPYLSGKAIYAIRERNPLTSIVLMLAALYLADWLIRFLQQFFMASIGQHIIKHFRQVLFDKIKTLPLSFFDRHQHGELMSRLTNDVDNISTTISNSLTLLLTYGFTIVGVFFAMIWLSPSLTIIAMVGVLLVFVLTKVVTKHTHILYKAQQKELGVLNGHIEESISGFSVVKAFCRETVMEQEFHEKNDNLCKISIRALLWSGQLMPMMNVINNFCYLSVAVCSAALYIQGYLNNIGLITSFLLYVRQFTRPFVEIANIYNNFQTAVAGAERVFEILDEEPEPANAKNALPLINPHGEIEFKHVRFGYTEGKTILKDFNLKIPVGTQVAIVGATGSGKTTIINLLTRFYDVSEGSITLDGHDLREYRMEDLRSAFSVVLQDTALFAATVRENISYGHDDATFEEIQAAAKAVGADDFIQRLPNGYNTVLKQSGKELSQGERQLLTIARAVLTNAPIMILDEATSSVDTVTEMKIKKAVRDICENRTSFIIAHRLSTIRDADLIILLDNGQIVEQGRHEELIAQNGRYAKMYKTQIGYE